MSTEPRQCRDAPIEPVPRRPYAGSGRKLSRGLLIALDDVARVCEDLQESRPNELTNDGAWREYTPTRSARVRLLILRFRHSHSAPYSQLRSASLIVIAGVFAAAVLVLIVR
jgi:hypothetical protein